MKKYIWIVMLDSGESWEFEAAFSTETKAKKFADNREDREVRKVVLQ